MRRSILFMTAVAILCSFGPKARAQTPEQRALIGRLQQGNTPCDPTSRDPAMMQACSNRAIAREVGRQQGFCWSEPRSAQAGGPVMRCTPQNRQP